MASDGPRLRVIARKDGGITLHLGSLSLDLERAEAERLHEETGRALMPGQVPPLVTRPAGHPDVIAWDVAHGDPGPQREASDD